MVAVKERLVDIVGANNVLDSDQALAAYADLSFAPSVRPRSAVKVNDVETVQKLVAWANETGTNLVPVSSGGPHYKGDTAPGAPETVIVDLSGMKKVLNINTQHRIAVIEPGVTYGELAAALAKEGMRLEATLCPKADKSVVASLMEREPRLNAMHHWAYTEPLRCMEVTWGDGNRTFTGEAGGAPMSLEDQWKAEKWQVEPVGPMMLDLNRLLIGAQGAMGIVTWASVRVELMHALHKSFVVPAGSIDELIEFVRKVTYYRFSDELFVLNNMQLAALLCDKSDDIVQLSRELPPYVALVGIGGRQMLPEMRVAQQEADIAEIAQNFGLEMIPAICGYNAEAIMQKASSPCEGTYWKARLKGGFQDIFFLTTLSEVPQYVDAMYDVTRKAGYHTADIGVYLQPIHMGSGYHLEFTLPYDPCDAIGTAKCQKAFREGSVAMSQMGAYYSRPYGQWAELQMNKDATSRQLLRDLKGIFDPNGIMNPGKLCL